VRHIGSTIQVRSESLQGDSSSGYIHDRMTCQQAKVIAGGLSTGQIEALRLNTTGKSHDLETPTTGLSHVLETQTTGQSHD
jgi:hypothetical protein